MKKLIYLLLLPCMVGVTPLMAEGKKLKSRTEKTMSLQDRYSHILDAMQKQRWKELVTEGKIILSNFSYSPFAQDVLYYMGIAYFRLNDFELANNYFSEYLKDQSSPKYFEEAIGYKFAIAQKFEEGAKRHFMGLEKMPKWLPAKAIALTIYDEVITSLPRHDLAAQALYHKGCLLFELEEYKEGIEAFQSLIRRFPKHSLAPESYIGISQIFMYQCKKEFPDPDLLDLAEINLRKLKQDFPGEPRIARAEDMLSKMKENFGKELYDIGKFYERTKKIGAAGIYYKIIMIKYPDTQTAIRSKKRLIALNQPIPNLESPPSSPKEMKGILVESEQEELSSESEEE